jgi:hypothetical protein
MKMNINMTELEKMVMSRIVKDDFYERGFDSELWMDVFLDNIPIETKITRAVVVSLEKKCLICISGSGRDKSFSLRENGMNYLKENKMVDEEGYPIK